MVMTSQNDEGVAIVKAPLFWNVLHATHTLLHIPVTLDTIECNDIAIINKLSGECPSNV